ncbi:MAG: phage Gp37/Gp68 family protein [Pseudomonadales bacterium]|nr:phage Gp37/Gp68 family protein [Pseudomonadales bacterium]
MCAMSKIEWTEQTWNPVTGCVKVSPGCKHCYAETMARRLQAMGAPGYENGFALSLLPERLGQPLRRRKPTMYFVNSMSDLFQDGVPPSFIDQVMDVIRATPQHTYQILTKRSANMRDYFATRTVPDNAWLGVSVEDRKYGKPRIPDLVAINAKTRFLSVEPLLEELGRLELAGIQWVIVGGESGRGARPMKEAWAMNVRNQCLDAGVDFFFKQWGAWGADGQQRNKKANGRELGGQVWDMIPSVAVC